VDLQSLLEGVSLKKLSQAFTELSEGYRSREGYSIDSDEKALAYLLYRSPATMGVLHRVLKEVPGEIHSVCDCGAGTGTSLGPLHDAFPIKQITLIEENKRLVSLGRRINTDFHDQAWKTGDLKKLSFSDHDLFLFSYSLNELSPSDARLVIRKAYQRAGKFVVIIEPGTIEGYQRILGYREALIEEGGFVIAPCPHMNECPLGKGDWCHFSERIERSKEHRYIKGGSLGYEDEKYSYLIVSKEKMQPNGERILMQPKKEKRGLVFKVCGLDGLEERVVTKRQKNTYQSVKKQGWGDTFPVV